MTPEFEECEYRGVTTLINHVFGIDLSHIPEWIMVPAQERGTAVHEYIESYLKGDKKKIHFEYYSYRDSFHEWLEQFNDIDVVGLEVELIDHENNVKGVVDFIGYLDGELYVIDWKTSTNMRGETLMSAEIQSLLYKDMVERLLGFDNVKTRVVSIQKGKYTDIPVENNDKLVESMWLLWEHRNKYRKPKKRVVK